VVCSLNDQQRADSGKITKRHFSDCLKTCRRVVEHFGKFTRAIAMRANDFQAYQAAFPSTWGTSMISGEIHRKAFFWTPCLLFFSRTSATESW